MHNVNLGIAQICNGSSLSPACPRIFKNCFLFVHLVSGELFTARGTLFLQGSSHLRVTLVLGGFYGNPNDSIAVNFRRAYRHFQAWRKSKRVNITQGVWKYGYATWLENPRGHAALYFFGPVQLSFRLFGKSRALEFLSDVSSDRGDQGEWACLHDPQSL